MFWSDKRNPSPAKPSPKAGLVTGQVIERDGLRLKLKLNARARRISLRIDNKTGEAVVTAPRQKDFTQALEFALSRGDWIREKTRNIAPMQGFAPGQTLTIKGMSVTLRQATNLSAARLVSEGFGHSLIAGGEGEAYHRRIERYLRREAQTLAEAHVTRYAEALGVTGVKVSLFDAKGRWGSCTPLRRTIRLSWRLILSPPTVFDYVCAHEAAHLRHPHHGPEFWAEVKALFGDHRAARTWLKDQGLSLYAFGI
jgi:predicted metal-dependent hydrolase